MRGTQEKWKRLGDEIAHLVARLHRLRPDHRDPHRFHEEKSEIAFQLTQVAKRIAE